MTNNILTRLDEALGLNQQELMDSAIRTELLRKHLEATILELLAEVDEYQTELELLNQGDH